MSKILIFLTVIQVGFSETCFPLVGTSASVCLEILNNVTIHRSTVFTIGFGLTIDSEECLLTKNAQFEINDKKGSKVCTNISIPGDMSDTCFNIYLRPFCPFFELINDGKTFTTSSDMDTAELCSIGADAGELLV